MKKFIKYISMFMLIWLQLSYFFEQLNSLSTLATVDITILGGIAVYIILFLIYFFLLMAKKLTQKQIDLSESVIIGIGFLISLGMFGYYMSNEWIWQEADSLQLILLEVWKSGAMVLASTVSVVSHFILKQRFDTKDNHLWNTYQTIDGIFFLVFAITSFGLTTATSKIIPHTTRNYFEYLQVFITLVILGITWNMGRVFTNKRKLFYAAVIGYFLATVSGAIEFLFLLSPLLKQQFETIGLNLSRITVMDIFTIIHLVVIGLWLIWIYSCEKRAVKASIK